MMCKTSYINGDVWTMDNRKKCSAISIDHNRISRAGSDKEIIEYAKANNHEIIDLSGKTVVPGFIDAHMHLGPMIYAPLYFDCSKYNSINAITDHLLEKASDNGWIVGKKYDHETIRDKRHLTKNDLDAVSKDIPIFIIHVSGHIAYINSKAMEVRELTSESFIDGGEFGKNENGELNGILYEYAVDAVYRDIPEPSEKQIENCLMDMAPFLHEMGITSVHDSCSDSSNLYRKEGHVYRELAKRDNLPIRINLFLPYQRSEDMKNDMLDANSLLMDRETYHDFFKVSTIKTFADGSLRGGTAAITKPYKETNNYGMLTISEEIIDQYMKAALATQKQLAIHALGDHAVDFVISSYKKYLTKGNDKRWRIEHYGMASDENIFDTEKYGIYSALNPIFLFDTGDAIYEKIDKTLYSRLFRINSLYSKGLKLGFGSDCPVCSCNPLKAIASAINRKSKSGQLINENEKIDIYDAFEIYTSGGAYGSFDENIKGKLLPGYLADMVILDKKLDETCIDDIKVSKTILDGRIVYECS